MAQGVDSENLIGLTLTEKPVFWSVHHPLVMDFLAAFPLGRGTGERALVIFRCS